MSRSRPQYLLADLVAIIVLCGFGLALVRSLGRPGDGNPAIILFLMGIVAAGWNAWIVMRKAPTCTVCGQRVIAPATEASARICPQCGQPQLGSVRSRNALAIGFWVVLALILLVVALTCYLTMNVAGAPIVMVTLASALSLGVALLLGVWLVLFFTRLWVESAQPKPAPCDRCGCIIPLTETTGPSICHQCRLRGAPENQPRKNQAKGAWALLALLLSLGAFAGFILPVAAGPDSGTNYWITVPLTILATTVGLPLVFISSLVLLSIIRAQRFRREPFILASARTAAGEEGEVVNVGPITVWYAGPTNPVPMLLERMELTRSRLESLLGCETGNQAPLRILCFQKRKAFLAFFRPLFAHVSNWLRTKDGIFIGKPQHILAFCTEEFPFSVSDLDKSLGMLFYSYFASEMWSAKPPALWLQVGVCQAIVSDRDDRARVNRKMLVALSRQTALATELFTVNHKDAAKFLRGWSEHRNFARLEQFSAEAFSVFEYLGGEQASAESRDRLRDFLNDNQSKDQPDEVFKRHFGFDFRDLSENWRVWVQEQGIGIFAPPRPFIKDRLLNQVIPLVKDRQATREDRIMAIRAMGIEGYIVGADELISLLQSDDSIPREEVVWSLEAISGMANGDDHNRWAAWWSGLADEIRAGRRPDEDARTSPVVAEHASSAAVVEHDE